MSVTFTTGESLFSFRSETGTLILEPGWYRVDQKLVITGAMTIESGAIMMTASMPRRPESRAPGQDVPQRSLTLPPDSSPPWLVGLLSWLRRPQSGRGGPPSGSPVAGL